MSDKELSEKKAYFKEQELLDISDDETCFLDEGFLKAECILEDPRPMCPRKLARQGSSFLGPTPKERQAEFESYATKQRALARQNDLKLQRSATAPNLKITKNFNVTKPKQRPMSSPEGRGSEKSEKTKPRSTQAMQSHIPFYKRMGVIPRELKGGKNVKPADNIKLEPEHKQLLRNQLVYFYPNDDISIVRRQRIHKVIQLGAAWVTSWRNDITYIIVDDSNYTYSQLLKHINKPRISRRIILVNYEPYIPQCIQFGRLQDPMARRFLVKGAPRPTPTTRTPDSSSSSSQGSLQIKSSRRQIATLSSQKTDSVSTKESLQELLAPQTGTGQVEEIVKDSFTIRSSPGGEDPVDYTTSYDGDDDALSQAIQETKAIAHLPLDEEEDDFAPTNFAMQEDIDSSTDAESPKSAPNRSPTTKITVAPTPKHSASRGLGNQNAFQCMNPGNLSSFSKNPNARTIQVLEEMGKYYNQMQDQWRTLAYRKAVNVLRKQDAKISTAKEAAALPCIGPRLADKIEEIVLTDRLRRLDNTKDDPTDQVLRLFLSVYGAGLSQANKWIQAGYRTLEDLVNHARLTESQKVGIEHYEDFAARIPRAEVELHAAIVRKALKKIDSGFEVTIMGSYRRGGKDSGDIDLIISRPGATLSSMRTLVFETLIPRLFKLDFLKVSLATSRRSNDGTKWHGASCLPTSNIWRRLDLLLVPEDEIGAALLYFTGNDIFNRSMRLLASKKGMRLNQRGLYKGVIRGKNREKLNEGTLVEGRDEKKIFQILGVPWREPAERIC